MSEQHSPQHPAGPQNIFLVGLMGAGKTSVGRMLAKRMSKDFYDADAEIERTQESKIPVIFDIEGESGFRAREEKVIERLTACVTSCWQQAVVRYYPRQPVPPQTTRPRHLPARSARRPVRRTPPRSCNRCCRRRIRWQH